MCQACRSRRHPASPACTAALARGSLPTCGEAHLLVERRSGEVLLAGLDVRRGVFGAACKEGTKLAGLCHPAAAVAPWQLELRLVAHLLVEGGDGQVLPASLDVCGGVLGRACKEGAQLAGLTAIQLSRLAQILQEPHQTPAV